jgi:Ca2+-binding EF-hand superfamily protein
VKDIGESVTIEELKEMIKYTTGGDAEISPDEFFNMFKRSATSAAPLSH